MLYNIYNVVYYIKNNNIILIKNQRLEMKLIIKFKNSFEFNL